MSTKPRVVKDYDKIPTEIQEQLARKYPMGFQKYLIKFKNKEGVLVSAMPFETEEKSYLIRMTISEATEIQKFRDEADADNDDDDIVLELGAIAAGISPEFEDELEEE